MTLPVSFFHGDGGFGMFGSTPAKSGLSVMKNLSDTGLYVPSDFFAYVMQSSTPFPDFLNLIPVALERYQSKTAERKNVFPPQSSISTPTRVPRASMLRNGTSMRRTRRPSTGNPADTSVTAPGGA